MDTSIIINESTKYVKAGHILCIGSIPLLLISFLLAYITSWMYVIPLLSAGAGLFCYLKSYMVHCRLYDEDDTSDTTTAN